MMKTEPSVSQTKNKPSVLRAWAFYDWANSVYALVISSSIFPLFYGALFRLEHTETWNILGIETPSESIISYITALGFILVAILSPLLSGVADYLGNKKFFMKFFCYMGAINCGLLFFFDLAHIYLGLLFYLLALVGFWASLVFYNSYLPDIATPEKQDRVSAQGFSYGYIGSIILLIINLIMIMNYKWFSFENEIEAMRYSFLLVGIWWIGFSQISYAKLPDLRNKKPANFSMFRKGFRELKKVYHSVIEQKEIKSYLTAFFVYSMAVQTIMIIAAYFGEKEVQWADDEARTMGLIVSILIIQIIAVVGAILTSNLAQKIGNYKVLILLNIIWLAICLYAYTVQLPMQFYITAGAVGLVMGGIQSLSRSTFSKLISDQKDTTSFFSFYDVVEKIGIVIGMMVYGLTTQLTGKVQNAILALALFFLLGIFLLFKAKKIKNKE